MRHLLLMQLHCENKPEVDGQGRCACEALRDLVVGPDPETHEQRCDPGYGQ